jgi:hypothetical protein
MTIRRFLNDDQFGPQELQLLDLMYRRTLRRLGLVDRGDDPVCQTVARKIIEIYNRGASNPIGISELAIRELDLPKPE